MTAHYSVLIMYNVLSCSSSLKELCIQMTYASPDTFVQTILLTGNGICFSYSLYHLKFSAYSGESII